MEVCRSSLMDAILPPPALAPPLDKSFYPTVLERREYQWVVAEATATVDVSVVLERQAEHRSRVDFRILEDDTSDDSWRYVERLVKFLLWSRGGWKLTFAGPEDIGSRLTNDYSTSGKRAFDVSLMSKAYRRPFEVVLADRSELPEANEKPQSIGGEATGRRIGIDLGASDYKISAVVDGKVIYSDEIPWDPKTQSDPSYHVKAIRNGVEICEAKLGRIDAIGVSSAGVYIDNEPRVASLYRSVDTSDFDRVIRPLFKNIGREYGAPLVAINDGEVSALAGGQYLGKAGVLGLAMGSSEAVGYLNRDGQLETWLNELAFCPVDSQANAAVDEWSEDVGVGANYFSQQAVNRLAIKAGIDFGAVEGLPERLILVQKLMSEGDDRAHRIYESIGSYLGYAMAGYREFYDYSELLLLGRVSSGEGGDVIAARAREILAEEFPELGLSIHVPDEKFRRVGQSIAAASLPIVDQ